MSCGRIRASATPVARLAASAPLPASMARRLTLRQLTHIGGRFLTFADCPAGLHAIEKALNHHRSALGLADVAYIDAGYLRARLQDVEPDHLAGPEVD